MNLLSKDYTEVATTGAETRPGDSLKSGISPEVARPTDARGASSELGDESTAIKSMFFYTAVYGMCPAPRSVVPTWTVNFRTYGVRWDSKYSGGVINVVRGVPRAGG